LTTTTASFGADEFLFPETLFEVIDSLGRGSSSCVLRVKWLQNTVEDIFVVLKVSANSNCIRVEKAVLQQLEGAFPSTAAFFPRLFHPAENLQPDDWYPMYMTVFAHEYSALTLRHFKMNVVSSVWNSLKLVHDSIGFAHCDVRIPNVMVNASDQVVLIDWSFARPLATNLQQTLPGGVLFQKPTMITASEPVLNQIAVSTIALQVYPADEAFSVVYLALQMRFPKVKVLHKAQANTHLTLNLRKNFLRKLTSACKNQSQLLAAVNLLQEDFTTLQQIEGRKHLSVEQLDQIVSRSIRTILVKLTSVSVED
jgi:hypothetical protein